MIYTFTSGAGPLFYSNDQHNILTWSSKLCLVRTNRIFLHPALFFLSPPGPFKSQHHFPPTDGTPRAVGELQPAEGPRLFHEIPWNLLKTPGCGRASISCSQPQAARALQSGAGLQSSDPSSIGSATKLTANQFSPSCPQAEFLPASCPCHCLDQWGESVPQTQGTALHTWSGNVLENGFSWNFQFQGVHPSHLIPSLPFFLMFLWRPKG